MGRLVSLYDRDALRLWALLQTDPRITGYTGSDGIVRERVKAGAAMSPDALVLRDGNSTTVVHIGIRKVLEALQATNRGQVDGIFSIPNKATRMMSARLACAGGVGGLRLAMTGSHLFLIEHVLCVKDGISEWVAGNPHRSV